MASDHSKDNVVIYAILALATAAILYLYRLTQNEFLLELSSLPVEILVTVFILDRFLRRREARARRQRLRHIKGYLFRSDMRRLFVANVNACARPDVSMSFIRSASLEELKARRQAAARVEYPGPEAMEPIVAEYVAAEPVWKRFMDIAIANEFDDIFQAMVYILHFVADVRQFQERHPGESFARHAQSHPRLRDRMEKVLGDGIRAFLDYAIELKEHQPDLFTEVFGGHGEEDGRGGVTNEGP